MNMLKKYWFRLNFGCKGTDFLIKWSGEMYRSSAGETLLLLAGVDPSPLCLALQNCQQRSKGLNFLGLCEVLGTPAGCFILILLGLRCHLRSSEDSWSWCSRWSSRVGQGGEGGCRSLTYTQWAQPCSKHAKHKWFPKLSILCSFLTRMKWTNCTKENSSEKHDTVFPASVCYF